MDQRSKLGYSANSPFNMESANQINANGITMKGTRRPLIAANKNGAAQLQPGREYPNIKGPTTEMPIESLLELEPVLLEIHLSNLKGKDKEIFMEKYQVLGTQMKTAALTQMLGKYPEVAQQQQTMQSGGATLDPWGNPTLQGFYSAPQESLNRSPIPTLKQDASQFYDPQATQGRIDDLTNQILSSKVPVTNAESENYDKQIKTSSVRPFDKNERERKMGGKTGLSKAKAAEMLHDGTVNGKPITEKQRRFFAATAYGKKKKMQDGGNIDPVSVKSFDKEKLKAVQMDLKAKGLYTGRIDGIYGPLTERAINTYNKPSQISKEDETLKYQPVVSESRKGNRTATRRPTEEEIQAQLDATGTNEERSGQMLPKVLNKRLYDNFLPSNYKSKTYASPVTRFLDATVMGNPDPSIRNTKEDDGSVNPLWKNRYDAWAMYLGQPQKDNSFKVSAYKPTDNTGDGYYYDFNNITDAQKQTMLKEFLSSGKKDKVLALDNDDAMLGAMGTYKLSKGKDTKGDYVSYYDKWDLAGSKGVGKPFDIYGRIYYDPKTAKIKKQSGGSTDAGWKYEAPPTEGFVLAGIESNRPTNNVKELPPQGNVKPTAAGRRRPSASPKLQDESGTVEAQSAYKPTGDYTDEEFKDYLRNKTRYPGATSIQDFIRIRQEEATAILQAGNYDWSQDGPAENGSTVSSLRNPSWLQSSRPAQPAPQVSNTTRAIAAVSADPVWGQVTPKPPARQTPASSNDLGVRWGNEPNFGDESNEIEEVKTYSNGDRMIRQKSQTGIGYDFYLYSVKGGAYGWIKPDSPLIRAERLKILKSRL